MMLKILNKTLNYCQITQKKEQIFSYYPYIETVYSLVVSNYNNIELKLNKNFDLL